MGVVVKAIEKFLDAFVHESVVRDVPGPILELRFGGKLALKEKISGFEISAFFGEFFDGVTAVAEDALVAVNVRDAADAGGGVVEGGVVAHHAKIGRVNLDLAEVHGADGAVGDGDFV